MIRIQSFDSKSLLKNSESLTFGREIAARILRAGALALNPQKLFVAYQDALLAFGSCIIGIKKSPLTMQMQETGATREYLFSGINEQIRIATRHFNVSKKASATRLMLVVNMYTDSLDRSYTDQTDFMSNFIQVLTSDNYKADVEALCLTQWVENLKKSNDLCGSFDNKRAVQKVAKASKETIAKARSAYEQAYDALVECLNAIPFVDDEEFYADLFDWWNDCIDRYQIVVSNDIGANKEGVTSGIL